MKKLMIAAAIVCVAVVSQAASFKWSASGVKDASGEAAYTGSATLYAIIGGSATAIDTTTMTAGAITAADNIFSDDRLVAGTTYSFYYSMTDAEGNVFTSGTKTGKANVSSTVPLSFLATGSWETVPEPTSGLLLLLGVAGLALKRKRA